MAASVAEFYEVQWRLKGTDEKWSASYRASPTGEIVVKGLGRADDYEFRVRAVSSCGARSIWVGSDYTVPNAPPPQPVLQPPTGSGHSDGVSLDWGDGSVPRADVMYQIDRAPATAPYASDPPPEDDASWARVATVAATNWTDSLTNTAHYWYRVRAVSFTGATSAWVVLNAPLAATVSTISLQDYVNQQFTQLEADTAGLRNDVDGAIAQVQVLQGKVGDILQADTWSATATYPKGDLVQYNGQLFRSLIDANLNHEPTASSTDANWEYIGNYASLGEAVGATAANVATLQNTVTQQGDTITANSQSISQNAAAIGAKADASALNATNATVTQQGQQITAVAQDTSLLGAHNAGKTAFVLNQGTVQVDSAGTTLGQYITGVQAANTAVNARVDSEQTARANGDAANASAITAVQANASAAGGNLLRKYDFSDGSVGGFDGGATVGSPSGYTAQPSTSYQGKFVQTGSGTWSRDQVSQFAVTPYEAFEVSANMFDTSASGSGFGIMWVSSTGAYISESAAAITSAAGQWQAKSGVLTAPAGASFGRPSLQPVSGSILCVTQPKIRRLTNQAVATASATQSLQAGTTINGTAYAAATTMVDANGRIGGTRLASDGTVSSFTVVADQFAVVAPAGGARTEFSGGNWRVYDAAGTLRVRMGVW